MVGRSFSRILRASEMGAVSTASSPEDGRSVFCDNINELCLRPISRSQIRPLEKKGLYSPAQVSTKILATLIDPVINQVTEGVILFSSCSHLTTPCQPLEIAPFAPQIQAF